MALPEIKIVLTAVSDGAKRGVKAVAGEIDSLGTKTELAGRKIQAMGDRITGLGKGLSIVSGAIVAAGAGMFALTKSTADAGDKIAKTARAAGVSGEYFQEMAYAIGQVSDLSEGQFGDALGYLTKQIGEAAKGTAKAKDALTALGYTQDQIASGAISTEEAFSRFVEKMDGSVQPAIAAALSADLFGRSASGLGPQLAGAGSEVERLRAQANELGVVLSQDTLDASEKFGDQMDTLTKSIDATKNVIGAALLPILVNTLLPAIQDKVIPAIASMASSIEGLIGWFSDLPGPVQEAVGIVAAALGAGGPIFLAVGVLTKVLGGLVAASGPIGLLITAAALLGAAWITWGDDIKAAVGAAVDWVITKFNEMLDFVAAIPGRMIELGAQIVDGLKAGIAERWEAFKEWLWSLVPEIPSIFRDSLEIKSPSRVMAEIGGQIGAGLAQGIADTQSLVNQAVGTLTGAAIGSTENMTSRVLGSLGQMFQGSKKIAAAQALVNAWAGATEALKLPFPENLFAFAQVLATGLGAVSQIKSVNKDGGGGGGGGGAGRGAGGGRPGRAAPQERRVAEFRFVGGNVLDPRAIVDAMNDAYDQGYQIRGVLG